MSNLIKAYFACNDEMMERAGERGGAYGLDENSDTWEAIVYPNEGFIFHRTLATATEFAYSGPIEGLKYVYEARFEPEELVNAVNAALTADTQAISFLTKEILTLAN